MSGKESDLLESLCQWYISKVSEDDVPEGPRVMRHVVQIIILEDQSEGGR